MAFQEPPDSPWYEDGIEGGERGGQRLMNESNNPAPRDATGRVLGAGSIGYKCEVTINAAAPLLLEYRFSGQTVNGSPGDPALLCYQRDPGAITVVWQSELWPTRELALKHALTKLQHKSAELKALIGTPDAELQALADDGDNNEHEEDR